MSRRPASEDDPRLGEMLQVIFSFAAGNLAARGSLHDDDSALDGVMAGINILGEELEASSEEIRQANASMREALEYAQTLIDLSPHGIFAVDCDLRITEWNRAMVQMFGNSREDAVGRFLDEIPFMKETSESPWIRTGLEGAPIPPRELAYRFPDADEDRAFELAMAPLRDHAGRVQGAVLRVGDVTERRRAEEKLRFASAYARRLIEANLDPLGTIDANGTIMDVNAAAIEATGVPRAKLIGSELFDYFSDPDKARAAHGEAFAKGFIRNRPLTLKHVSGMMTEVLFNASVYHTENGDVAGILAAARDISDRRRAEQAEELANHDALTNLYNRRAFVELLEDELAHARRYRRPLSLLMLDIDHFKRVNDTYGHQAGDAMLRHLSDLLLDQVRPVDHVCRYGGEEFSAILPETELAMALEVAERLRAEVERRPVDFVRDNVMGMTVSVGVATYPQQAASLDGFIRAADMALYAAKQAGRNRVLRYYAHMPDAHRMA